MEIEVSLWGPCSLLTSMFGPTVILTLDPALEGTKVGEDRTRYFDHQVGKVYCEPDTFEAFAGIKDACTIPKRNRELIPITMKIRETNF